MKNKLFGRNIAPDCSYCENSYFENGIIGCKKSKRIQDGRCRAFSYDPLMRVPRSENQGANHTVGSFYYTIYNRPSQ